MSSLSDTHATTRRVLRRDETSNLALANIVVSPDQLPTAASIVEDQGGDDLGIERLIEAARREGYEAGRLEGMRDPMILAEQRRAAALDATRQKLSELAVSVEGQRQAVVDEVVADALGLAFELLSVLVGEELALEPTPALNAVRRALHIAPANEDLIVHLHPDSGVELADLEAMTEGIAVAIRFDPAVEPGGAIVEAGPCRIDAQIGPALERVRDALTVLRTERGWHA
jgi:flagellar assembly protein FliH